MDYKTIKENFDKANADYINNAKLAVGDEVKYSVTGNSGPRVTARGVITKIEDDPNPIYSVYTVEWSDGRVEEILRSGLLPASFKRARLSRRRGEYRAKPKRHRRT
jgi:hypothetical protein|tara:strand:+ start:55 stop:372 length:318 start_codon:yes stop_codon:yes gene_type:complete